MKLTLLLPIPIATVMFSAIKFIKNSLRNRMGNELMKDYLVTHIKKDIFDKY